MIQFFQKLEFAEPWWALAFLILPFLWFLSRRQGAPSALAYSSLGILGSLGSRTLKRPGFFAFASISLALTAGIIALMRPQHRDVYTARTASGIDIMLTLDLSLSMQTEDFRAPRDRFSIARIEASKRVLKNFVRLRPNDRLGLVVFSGLTYPACPLTLDHKWLQQTIGRLSLEDLEEPGTAIGSAIAAASTRLENHGEKSKVKAKSKIIVLITDGESNSGELTPKQAAELAAELGIKIYTIAIGSEDGRLSSRYMAAPQQEFDTETLKEIASITKGEFFHARDFTSLEDTFKSIDSLEKTEAQVLSTVEETEFYPYLLGAAAVFALLTVSLWGFYPPLQP